MKHSLLMLSLVFVSNTLCMEPIPARKLKTQSDAVTVEIQDEATQLTRMSISDWKNEVTHAIRDCKSNKLLQLLSPEGRPAPTRGRFVPYTNALEQIKAHKDREVRILTNQPDPDAKCCRCCNTTYVWNRFVAPGLIVGVKTAQLAFAIWGIQRAAQIVLTQTPGNYIEAAASAAPAIGSLVATFGDLPFSVINAWRRHILKTQQAKYEYYLLAEHSVTMQNNIETLLLDNQRDLKELLARDPSPYTRAADLLKRLDQLSEQQDAQVDVLQGPPSNQGEIPDIEALFGEGIVLEKSK